MSDIKLTLGNEAPAAATQTAEEIMPEKKVPEPAQPVFTPEEQKTIDEFSKKIDVTDTNLVFQYGAGTQQKIAQFSDSALASVQTKDLGEVGDMMANLVAELKGFNADPDEKKGLFGFIRKNVDKMTLLKARYDEAEVNVNKIVSSLESHQVTLLKDIATLDQLYEMNLDYFKELSMYIAAGKKRLEEVRATDLAEATKRAEASGLAEDAQAAKDLADKCDRFEKKLYDLELTRNIAIQMGPQIRLIQNNDQVMAEKIQSTMVNTIPLWKSQMVIALGLHHAQEAMKAQRSVSDLTNDLLRSNAERLHTASVEVAKESERGIIDIETLTATNQRLIDTMDEVLAIQQDGREKRRAAEGELARIEGELRSKLLEINNKKSSPRREDACLSRKTGPWPGRCWRRW